MLNSDSTLCDLVPATLSFVSSPKTTRLFLETSAASAGAFNLPAADPSFHFPADAAHRLSVSTYPFRSVIGSGKMSLQDFAATIVDKFGVYGIEPWSNHFDSIDPEYIRSLKAAFTKANLQVVNIPCDVNVRPCGTPEEQMEAQMAWRNWVDVAVMLGSPSIRVHVEPPQVGNFWLTASDALRHISDYASEKGIVINLENDDPRSEDPAVILKLITVVNRPWVRCLPDFCNSMQVKDSQDYNAKALADLFPYAYNISHVKDVEVVNGKTLTVDVNRIFKIARSAGYKGFFSMETEGSLDPYIGTRNLIASALKNLS